MIQVFAPEYRGAGLLLHVTSLPSRYGIGDLGPAAFTWIDRLCDAGQSWWQALPLGPTGYANSPYQALSSFAGNWLLISPDALVEEGLLRASDYEGRSFPADFGARPQRLLWASTGTKDPKASDTLYVNALAVPFTVNTMPEGTLKAFGDHGKLGATLQADGGDSEEVLAQFAKAGIDIDALANQLQDEGAKSFVKSWDDLMNVITAKSAALKKAS